MLLAVIFAVIMLVNKICCNSKIVKWSGVGVITACPASLKFLKI